MNASKMPFDPSVTINKCPWCVSVCIAFLFSLCRGRGRGECTVHPEPAESPGELRAFSLRHSEQIGYQFQSVLAAPNRLVLQGQERGNVEPFSSVVSSLPDFAQQDVSKTKAGSFACIQLVDNDVKLCEVPQRQRFIHVCCAL